MTIKTIIMRGKRLFFHFTETNLFIPRIAAKSMYSELMFLCAHGVREKLVI